MAKIKVHVLNFHSIFSHIEIVLENTSTEPHTYYGINRWQAEPEAIWSTGGPKSYIRQASSVYSFEIEANPEDITNRWQQYWTNTHSEASIIGKNCAVAAQWFLTEFANIPEPSLSNVSWNHLALGIIWPSFIPCPITLPGRIMSNAKFYVEARTNPAIANQYSYLFIYTTMTLAVLAFATSVFAIAVAASILSAGLAALVITGSIAAGVVSAYPFFKARNLLLAKNISAKLEKDKEPKQDTFSDLEKDEETQRDTFSDQEPNLVRI